MKVSPIITWSNAEDNSEAKGWNVGTIDAGTESKESSFLIWNNKGSAETLDKDEDAPNMFDCVVTTKLQDGSMDSELVYNQWINVKVDSLNESVFTPIGAVKKGDGSLTPKEKSIQAEQSAIDKAGIDSGKYQHVICGKKNDGSIENSKANNSKITLKAIVPSTASAGRVDFFVRVIYKYE